jgi:ketosteroid isomerase-like protein
VSQENMKIVRRLIEAVDRKDGEAVLACMDPEIEFIPRRAAVDGPYHGHEGSRST